MDQKTVLLALVTVRKNCGAPGFPCARLGASRGPFSPQALPKREIWKGLPLSNLRTSKIPFLLDQVSAKRRDRTPPSPWIRRTLPASWRRGHNYQFRSLCPRWRKAPRPDHLNGEGLKPVSSSKEVDPQSMVVPKKNLSALKRNFLICSIFYSIFLTQQSINSYPTFCIIYTHLPF